MKVLVSLAFLLTSFSTFSMNLEDRFLVDGKAELEMNAGEKANLNLSYFNHSRGMNHRMFMKMHAKKMHMIIIRDDYSHIAHIHPYHNMETGEFKLDINVDSSDDFDNQGVVNAVPTSGRYYVFTEVMPMPMNDQMPMVMKRYELKASGEPAQESKLDFKDGKDGIDFYFDRSGKRSEPGAVFKVRFSYEQFDFCDRWLPKFYFEWFEKNERGEYLRAKNFERWLDMGGHSILLDADRSELKEKIFYHLHAFLPMSIDGEFVFPYHDHKNELPAGKFMIYGQFKHGGVIFTVPVPFKYTLPDNLPYPIDEKCRLL